MAKGESPKKKFFAFISYSSKDEKIVKWLHGRLENYRIPTSAASDSGEERPKYLRPIFWYKQDLSGTVLSESLRANLADSQYLIVICSPAGAASKWVNDEVATFIEQGKEAKIIPVIVDGEPNSGNPATGCFPEALRALGRSRELRGINLAAQGRQRALVDIIATMLGVRFDTLWQRHKRRERRRRVLIGLVALLLLGALWCVHEYKRTKTEYYLEYAEAFGVPRGIDRIEKKEMAEAGFVFRFSYSRIPLGEEGALRWRLDKVEYVSATGQPTGNVPSNYTLFFPAMEFRYQDGKLAEIINKDRDGHVKLRYAVKDDIEGNPAAIYDITGGEVEESAGYLSTSTAIGAEAATGETNRRQSKIKRIHLVRDARGLVSKMTFHSNNDDDLSVSVTSDNNDFYGMSYTRDGEGRVLSITYLDADGQPAEDWRGVATTTFSYGLPDRTIEFFNSEGARVYGLNGTARIVEECNRYGRAETVRYFDLSGRPMLSDDYVHMLKREYTEAGLEKSLRVFGLEGEPTATKDGWHRRELEYDGKGRVVRESYFDTEGRAVYNGSAFSSRTIQYGSDGNASELRFYDPSGAPAYVHDNGSYGERYEYDPDGHVVRVDFLGPDGKIADSPRYNYATIRYEYDKYHRCTGIFYHNSKGEMTRSESGHAGAVKKYDSRGNIIEVTYVGPDGEPTMTKWGYATIRSKYDAKGNVVGISFFDDKDEPVFTKGRYGEGAAYTERGIQCEKSYLDADGALMTGPEWWAFRRRTSDEKGRLIKKEYFGKDSLPVLDRDRLVAAVKYTYGPQGPDGSETVIEYFGKSGEPADCAGGYQSVRQRTDANKRTVGNRYYSAGGRPTMCKGLYHRDTLAYDDKGRMVMWAYFNPDGSAAVDGSGVHRYERDYDLRGLTVEERHYGPDGKLLHPRGTGAYAVGRWTWNGLGRAVEYRYFDEKMNPHNYQKDQDDTRAASLLRCDFDDRGLLRETAYYRAADTTRAFAYERHDFDAFHDMTRLEHLDADRKPVDFKYGSVVEMEYDGFRRVNSAKTYSAKGELVSHFVKKFDNAGRVVEQTSLGEDGKPKVAQALGMAERYARMEVVYDSRGNAVENRYYDAAGRLMDAGNGYAVLKMTYDDRNRRISQAAFDAKERPVIVKSSGYHKETTLYDDRNRGIGFDYFGTDGRPANREAGAFSVARARVAYDDYGRQQPWEFYSWDGAKYVPSKEKISQMRVAEAKSDAVQIFGYVETAGHFRDAEMPSPFFILMFDSWDLHQSVEKFGEVLASTSNRPRRIVLLPLVQKDGQTQPGEIIDRVFPAGPLGIRIMDAKYEGISAYLEKALEEHLKGN